MTAGPPKDGRDPSAQDPMDADRIVESWLKGLSRGKETAGSEDLLEAYRAFGAAVLGHGAGGPGSEDADRELDRTLGRVAAAVRRSRLRISEAMEDLGRLGPAAVEWLRAQPEATRREVQVLRRTTALTTALDGAIRRVVRVLEERALRAERERSEALAAMTDQLSHELRNRLSAARTASQMLVNPEISLDQKGLDRVAELVDASVDAALHTVGDVRTLFQTRSGAEDAPRRSAWLPKLIRTVIEDLSPTALEAEVGLRVEGEIVDCEVDAARLRLIVFNLVGNGIKYHDPDDDASVVRVRSRTLEDGEVEVKIEDNGIGIAGEDLDDIFLNQVRGAETDHVPGSGMGLAIVLEAVEQIDGTIDVESESGVGTTFTVRFRPLSGSDRTADEPAASP